LILRPIERHCQPPVEWLDGIQAGKGIKLDEHEFGSQGRICGEYSFYDPAKILLRIGETQKIASTRFFYTFDKI
jgi:hypothetical protein